MSYDDKGMKWLRIKNWEIYQLDNRMRNKESRLKFVLSHTAKLENYDYLKLSMFERSLYNDMIVLAGTRPYRTIPNDPTWIARSLHVSRTETPRVKHALTTCIERGFIIPIVTEKIFEEPGENTAREREGEREGERDSSVSQSFNGIEADASLLEEEEKGFKIVDLEVAVQDLPCFTLLHEGFGRSEMLPELTIRRIHSALVKLEKTPAWMQGCIQYVAKHRWWKERATHAEAFAKALINGINDPEGKKLPAQYDKHIAQRRAAGAGRR